MKKIARLAGLTLMLCTLAVPASARPAPGDEAVDRVRSRIEAGDCAGAASRLNEGLAEKYPEVNLLAGTMFENGVCLKADWNKAVHFYVKAYDGGQKAALYRLTAGFAAPERGPDTAAALWWATRDKQADLGLDGCRASDAAMADPDRFVAELATWPQRRLALCNYMAGVLATLSGEIRYPSTAMSYSLGGDFILRFLPAIPKIDIKTAETTEYQMLGVVNGNALEDRQSRRVKGSFEDELRNAAERALKRYPQPAGIDPASSAQIKFRFFLK